MASQLHNCAATAVGGGGAGIFWPQPAPAARVRARQVHRLLFAACAAVVPCESCRHGLS